MNAISTRCRSFNRGYNRVVRFISHFVVGSAPSTLLPTTSSDISYTLAEFSNEFKNENQEGHDFCNIFNAQMQAVAYIKQLPALSWVSLYLSSSQVGPIVKMTSCTCRLKWSIRAPNKRNKRQKLPTVHKSGIFFLNNNKY